MSDNGHHKECSGLENTWLEADVFGVNTINTLMDGKGHILTYEALLRLKRCYFLKDCLDSLSVGFRRPTDYGPYNGGLNCSGDWSEVDACFLKWCPGIGLCIVLLFTYTLIYVNIIYIIKRWRNDYVRNGT